MLRIANWFESRLGRNDGNPLYVQACLKRMQYFGALAQDKPADESLLSWFSSNPLDQRANEAAKKLWADFRESIEIDHLYPTGDVRPFGVYDLNIHVDWGEDGLTEILPYTPMATPVPFAYWASDTHLGYQYRLEMARKADYVFCAQKRAVEDMTREGVKKAIWLPHAVEPEAYPKIDMASKRYDVCFVGHVNSTNREVALDRLFREFPNFYYGQQLFENAARKFAESKICFNISMLDDLNMRTFEVMSTGSFLLTNWIPTIEEFFEDGKHLVLYRSEEEMIDKAKYYLAHDEERERIAQAGFEEVRAKHTIQHRVDVILGEFLKSKAKTLVGV